MTSGKSKTGRHLTDEHKKKLSIAHMGKVASEESRRRMSVALKGKKRSAATRRKMSLARTGKPSGALGKHWRLTDTSHLSGENNPRWIKDRTKLRVYNDAAKDRRCSAYIDWRKRVWARDNFTCKIANKDCSGRLEAHHILGFTEFEDLRYDINNGITLCHFHHPRKRKDEINLSPYFKELVMNKK